MWRCGAQQIASSTCGGSRPPNVDRRSFRRGAARAAAREVRKHLATAQQQPSTARCAEPRKAPIALRRASRPRSILLKSVFNMPSSNGRTRPNERPIRGSGRGTPGYAKPSAPTKKERRRPRVTPPRSPPSGSSLDSSDVANAPRSLRHQTRDMNDATREYRSNKTRAEFFYRECPGFRGGAASSRARGAPSRSRTGRRRPCPGPRRRSRPARGEGPGCG